MEMLLALPVLIVLALFLLTVPIMMAVLVASIAKWKGRDYLNWFVYGFLLFPVAIIHVTAIDKK